MARNSKPEQPEKTKSSDKTEGENMTLSDAGLILIKEFEGCSLVAYRDSVGVATIGYGKIRHADGTPVKDGDTCTQSEADQGLREDIEADAEHFMRAWIKIQLNQNQWDAICSFTFNRGSGRLRQLLATNDIAKHIRDFDYAGKPPKRLLGLARRRAAEWLMYIGKDWRAVDSLPKYNAWKLVN